MNFKLRKSKMVASVVIPLAVWMLLAFVNAGNVSSNFIMKFISIHNYNSLFSSGNIFLFIIEVVIVYVVISLFQKKYY